MARTGPRMRLTTDLRPCRLRFSALAAAFFPLYATSQSLVTPRLFFVSLTAEDLSRTCKSP
jgi:hypothetical protein